MVLESIIGERNVRKKPFLIFLITLAISVGSIISAYFVFPSHASVLSVSFITIGLVPMIHNVLVKEEFEETLRRKTAQTFFARHLNLIKMYVWIFAGVILAFSIVYVASPSSMREVLFQEQINVFCSITGQQFCESGIPQSITARFSETAFNSCQNPGTRNLISCFSFIFFNNIIVFFFIILLSLLYGAGAIFIIVWNASILGLFFGELFLLAHHIQWVGFLQGMLIGHGPPELLGYIFIALAGAIISAMVSRKQFLRHEFLTVMSDVIFLVFLAVFSIFYGAMLESIALMGHTEIYFLFGFVYMLAIIIIVIFYGEKEKILSKVKQKNKLS